MNKEELFAPVPARLDAGHTFREIAAIIRENPENYLKAAK